MVGALLRAGALELWPSRPGTWSWTVLVVNAIGALLLCALLARAPGERSRLLLGTGLLGGFTTASGLAVDAVLLADAGRAGLAALYVLVGAASLLLAGLAGAALGRRR